MDRKIIFIGPVLLSFVLILAGCNLFGWTSSDDYDSLIVDGVRELRDGNYDVALEKFEKAMEEDPSSSEARYYHAKATMYASGFNSFNLGVAMTESESDDLPFNGDSWPNERADRLKQAINTVYDDLKPIYEGKTTGAFTAKDVDLDFGITIGIKGILLFQDVNLDGVINGADYDFSFASGSNGGFGFAPGDVYNFVQQTAGTKKVNGAAANDTCDAIIIFNTLLDSIEVVINESRDVITEILDEESELSPEDIDEFLAEVISLAANWKINDPADNDSDGSVNEELINLIDDDGDGYYDEDGVWPSCVGYIP